MPVSAANADDYFMRDPIFASERPYVPPLTDEKRMGPWAIAGLTVLGLGAVAAAIGGFVWWFRKRKAEQDEQQLKPERAPTIKPSGEPRPSPDATPRPSGPRHEFVGKADLEPELAEELAGMFGNGWPPDDATIENLEQDDVIVFAVEGVPTGNFTQPRQELLSATVLSVEETFVRGRVKGPVQYAAHFGSHPGHGLEVGESVEVPRSKILVAARPKPDANDKPTGYDSQGKAAAQLKPTSLTNKVQAVKPGTPYDLVVPYRTDRLVWQVKSKDDLVTMIKIGEKGLLEQVKFAEASLRGPFSIVLLTDDPKEGIVFVARWDLDLQA